MAKPVAGVSPAAMMMRGALLAYLRPRLAMDSKPHASAMIARATEGLTSKNYAERQNHVINSLKRFTQGRLALDNGITDLAALLGALAPEAQQADQAPGLGQIATNPGGTAGPSPPPVVAAPDQGGSTHDIVAKIKAYLEEEGIAPEVINNLDSFLAEHQPSGPEPPAAPGAPTALHVHPPGESGDAFGADNIENLGEHAIPAADQEEDLTEAGPTTPKMGNMEPRGGLEQDLQPESAEDQEMSEERPWERDDDDDEAEDELVPSEQDEQLSGVSKVSSEGKSSRLINGGGQDKVITKSAMDKAIKLAQDRAIRNQRAIREAERFVRPWVGDVMAMDADNAAAVYREALKALGVRGADKMHPDALRPVLEAQPRPSARMARDQQIRMAQDSAQGKVEGSFLDRFPEAKGIILQ